MTNKIIKAGLQLEIQSWENDGDNYQIRIINELSKDDVYFILDFVKNFSVHDLENPKYGNQNNNIPFIQDLIFQSNTKYSNNTYLHKFKKLDGININVFDLMLNLFGTTDGYYSDYNELFCRVFESFKLYDIPKDIILLDITDTVNL